MTAQTMYQQACEGRFEQLAKTDARAVHVAYEVQKSKSPFFTQIFGQYRWNKKTLAECWMMAQLNSYRVQGKLLLYAIPVGVGAFKDREGDKANRVLEAMGRAYEGKFSGRFASDKIGGGGDGRIFWHEPVEFAEYVVKEERPEIARLSRIELEPGEAVLEMGGCPASRIWWRLMDCRALARWAYDDDKIWIIAVNPEWQFTWEIDETGEGRAGWERTGITVDRRDQMHADHERLFQGCGQGLLV